MFPIYSFLVFILIIVKFNTVFTPNTSYWQWQDITDDLDKKLIDKLHQNKDFESYNPTCLIHTKINNVNYYFYVQRNAGQGEANYASYVFTFIFYCINTGTTYNLILRQNPYKYSFLKYKLEY